MRTCRKKRLIFVAFAQNTWRYSMLNKLFTVCLSGKNNLLSNAKNKTAPKSQEKKYTKNAKISKKHTILP